MPKNPFKFLFPVPGLLNEILSLLLRHDTKLSELTLKLTTLEKLMPSIQDYTAMIREAAEAVKANNSVLASIVSVSNKIFDEVLALKNQNLAPEAFVSAVEDLRTAYTEQVGYIAANVSVNTKIDELNPDLVVTPNGTIVDPTAPVTPDAEVPAAGPVVE